MRRTTILFGSMLVIAAPAADAGLHYLAGCSARASFDRAMAAMHDVTAGRVQFDPWRQRLRIDDLAFGTPDLSVRVSRLTYVPKAAVSPLSRLVATALAEDEGDKSDTASVETISAENVVIESADATYTIPRIEITDTNLGQSELAALVAARDLRSVAATVGRINAAKVKLAEARVHLKTASPSGEVVYRGIELSDIVDGRVAAGWTDGLTATLAGPDTGGVEASCGPTRVKDYDIGQNLKVMSETASVPEEPKLLYASLNVENCKIKMGKPQATLEVGSFTFTGLKGRPLLQPWGSARDLFSPDRGNDAEVLDKRRAYLLDLYSAYEIEAAEGRDLRITSEQSDAAGSARLGRISLAGFGSSRIGEIQLHDLSFETKGTKLELASTTLRGLDLVDFAGLQTRKSDEPVTHMPILDEFAVVGLDIDAVDAKTDAPEHARFRLAKIDLTSTTTSDGVPSRLTLAFDHFTTEVGSFPSVALADIAALGYDKLDLSSRLVMTFDAEKQELGVEDASLTGQDMGFVKLSGQISNVTKDLFSQDQVIAEAAVLSLLVNRVEIKVENDGLFERYVAAAAKRQRKSPDAIRRDYVAAVSLGIPAALENGPGAKIIGAALAKFVASPKTFHLIARAPEGLGASDFALLKQPGALMERLEIQATANE